MSDYVLFLPPNDTADVMPEIYTADDAMMAIGRAEIGHQDFDRTAERAFDNAARTVRLSEAAGVGRISSDAQAYLQRIEEQTVGTMGAADVIMEAAADAQDRRDVTTFGTLGAVAIEGLSDGEVARLRAVGFEVVRNVETFVSPTEPAAEDEDEDEDTAWPIARCRVDRMHAAGFSGRGQRIGILDTGIDVTHPEFHGKSVEFAEFDRLGRLVATAARDSGDHGTHVAAIAAGNTIGVARDADLAVAAVLTKIGPKGNSGYLAQIIAGFEWLSGLGASGIASSEVCVVNASLGGTGFNDYLYAPIRRARALGIPFVAAIGNSGRVSIDRHGSPGNYNISIGIGASDFADEVADFSDWGTVPHYDNLRKPDLCAPGAAIRSAIPGGGYARKSGTSMAAPFVAGAVALLVQERPDIQANVSAIEALLYSRVVALTGTSASRGGRGRLAL